MKRYATLPLFSQSLRECLQICFEKHNSAIAKTLLDVDMIIEGFNNQFPVWLVPELEKEDYTSENAPYLRYWKASTEEAIAKVINDSVRMLSIREGTFEISFLPKGKDYKMTSNGNWATDNRQTGKPTRILRKLLISKEFSELDFELFNNQLRAIIETGYEFSIVSGEDITKWYHESKYENGDGTLGNSCMRYSEAQHYFEIYEDFASMLILTKREKLTGRAILWNINGKTYMDRVYVNKDHLVDMFIDYARKNKFIYRSHQGLLSTGDVQTWLQPEDNYSYPTTFDLRIRIEKEYEHWPYLDTFRYLYVSDSGRCECISTTPDGCNKSADDPDGWYCDMEEYPYDCYHCGRTYYSTDSDEAPEGLYWSEYYNEYICEHCATWSEELSDYIIADKSSCVYSSETNYDRIPTDLLEEEEDDYIKIEGTWYFTNCTLQTVIDHLNQRDANKD